MVFNRVYKIKMIIKTPKFSNKLCVMNSRIKMFAVTSGPDSGLRIGCFADDPRDRDLPYEPYTDPAVGMWPPMCVHHCFEKGYYYAGLQARYKCFCGNSYGRFGPVGTSQCNLPCFPGTQYQCGGTTSSTIYSTGLSK